MMITVRRALEVLTVSSVTWREFLIKFLNLSNLLGGFCNRRGLEVLFFFAMLTNIPDNTNVNLVATSTTCNIQAVICTTYNTSYLRHLQ